MRKKQRNFDDEDYRLFENVCDTCGKLFITTDEDMTLCSNCWNIYLKHQLKT